MERNELGLGCAHRAGADLKSALLGKDPRYAADRAFDTLHVLLDLTVSFNSRTVEGTCTATIRPFKEKLHELVFNACIMTVSSAKVDGRRVPFIHKDGRLILKPPRPLERGRTAQVDIRYKVVKPVAGLHFVRRGRGNGDQLWSQGQPEDSRYWFPCHDAPGQKSTSEIMARVPKGFTAVSNGVLISKSTEGARDVFHWRMDRPHALYLVSLAVGRFAQIRDRWEDVDVLFYCERGREEEAKRGFAKTVKAIDFFSKKLGVRYPYPKYAQVAVAEFPGGMENTTCTTQTDACLIPKEAALDNDMDYLVAHELAHQWFGDMVTCRDWSHAWLNEGFATYFEVLFTEHDKGTDEAEYELFRNRHSYFSEDEGRYRRAIVHNVYKYPWVLFDRHLYEKGACVLHMLRHELGDKDWWASMRRYLTRFRDKSVETADLITSIEEVTGRNLRAFFDQWVFRPGYPTLQSFYSYDEKSRTLELRVIQKGSDSAGLYKIPVKVHVTGRGWERHHSETLEKKEQVLRIRLPRPPEMVELDPEHVFLKKLESKKPFPLWVNQLRRSTSALSRIHAARHVAGWGDDEAVRALSAALKAEKFWGAAAEIAQALGNIRTQAAFAALRGALSLRHPKARRAVVQALGGYGRPELAATFVSLMRRDPSLHVRAEAARALGSLREARHIPALKALMRRRSYWDILASGAISGLANMRSARALPALMSACRAGASYPARAVAIRSLGGFAWTDESVVPALCSLLKSILEESDERLAMAAISTLGTTGDFRALPALREALKHPDSRIKTYAEEAIARIKGESDGSAEGKGGKT